MAKRIILAFRSTISLLSTVTISRAIKMMRWNAVTVTSQPRLGGAIAARIRNAPARRRFRLSRTCLADCLVVLACLSVLLVNLPCLLLRVAPDTIAPLPTDYRQHGPAVRTGRSSLHAAALSSSSSLPVTAVGLDSEHVVIEPARDGTASASSAGPRDSSAQSMESEARGSPLWLGGWRLPFASGSGGQLSSEASGGRLRSLLCRLCLLTASGATPTGTTARFSASGSGNDTTASSYSASTGDSESRGGTADGIHGHGSQRDVAAASRGVRARGFTVNGGYPLSHLRSLVDGSFFTPHPSLAPVVRKHRSHGDPPGTCIAIISNPRGHESASAGGAEDANASGGDPDSDVTARGSLFSGLGSLPFTGDSPGGGARMGDRSNAAVARLSGVPLEAGHAGRLLRLLDERRAKSPAVGGDVWAVVHASGCEGRQVGKGEIDLVDVEARALLVRKLLREVHQHTRWSVEELVSLLVKEQRERRRTGGQPGTKHLEALQNVSRSVGIKTYVLPAHQRACAVLDDVELLLSVVQPGFVEQGGWEGWRRCTKQAMDFIYVMHQCMATNPTRILLLHDTTPVPQWDAGIEKFISKDLRRKWPWALLSLHSPQTSDLEVVHAQEYKLPCCALAVLFDSSRVVPLLDHMELAFMRRPMVDNIHRYLLKSHSHAYLHVPSLFQSEKEVRSD